MKTRFGLHYGWLSLALALASVQGVAPVAAADMTLRAPNLAAYDCSALAKAPAGAIVTSQHLGQVIKGRYFEWNEYSIATNGSAPQLACVSLIAPRARPLTAAQARVFLSDSFAIGVLNSKAVDTSRATSDRPEKVRAEPRKHRILPSANAERAQAAATAADLPPVSVTKSSDPNSPENTAPAVTQAPNEAALAAPDADLPALTVGVEDRVQVTNTAAYPWNTVGYLVVTYPNGESFRCSGTLVSPYVVVTAGHCIHNNNRGGFVAQVRFYPGQAQASSGTTVVRPYGSHSDWQNLKTTQRWMQISGSDTYPVTDYQNDVAAIQFKTPFTHTSTFMPVVFSNTATTVTNGGYPAQVNNVDWYAPFTDSGTERAPYLRASHLREFAIDSSGGNSGGPFWATDLSTGRPALVGSLSYGDDLDDQSGGPYYDSWNQPLLSDWIGWTPNSIEVSQNSASGLRMASVFSSVQPDSQSFIRLYNPTATAGTVNVTLADYATGNLLGTWTSPSIPPGASLQYPIRALETGASTPVNTPPAFYSISVRPSFAGYFQHVLWRAGDGSITDLTTCDARSTEDPMLLMNVHSSILQSGYPSTVIIQNTGATNIITTLGIYDARNGARLGTYVSPVLPPNAQDIRSVAAMEAAAGIAPSAGMYHYIIRADTSFTGFLQHLVRNNSSGVITDMTPFCQMAVQ